MKSLSLFPWVGSKKQYIEKIYKFFPENFEYYYEPFVGAGSVFLFLKQSPFLNVKEWNISDLNEELILCYKFIKETPEEFTKAICNMKNDEETYYKIRNQYNEIKELNFEKIILFYYIVNFCFKGMIRKNSKGLVNCAYGFRNYQPKIFEKDIYFISELLQDVKINHGNYDNMIVKENNSFIFLDPPYHNTMDCYNEKNESMNTDTFHTQLKEYCDSSISKYICQTNNNNEFINFLYQDYNIFYYNTNNRMSNQGKNNLEIMIRNF